MQELSELIALGLIEKFYGFDGAERIRLTPEGARQQGDEALARKLESCKAGTHIANGTACVCGETGPTR